MSPNTQPATITTKVTAVIHSSRDIAPMPASSLRAAAGASGVAPTPGGKIFATSRGNIAIAMSDGTEEARNQFPKPISSPAFCAICTPIGLAGGGRHPERGRDREARHRAEHEVAAEPPSFGVVGLGARSLGDGQHDREEHAAARRVAGERRRDGRVGQHDAVGETERGAAEAAHHEEADAPAEPRLHHGLRDDECDHHEQHARIGETRERLRRRDRPGEDDGRPRRSSRP